MPSSRANGKVCYIEIPATDVQRSADFYEEVFGWRIRQRGDGHTAFDDATAEVSGTWVLGRPPAVEPGLLLYIMVDSVAATADAVVANGGGIVQPIGVDAPEMTARFRDPAGNVIGLYQEPSGSPSTDPLMTLRNEFDRQVENLLRKGYPEFSGMGPEAFVQHVVPLSERLPGLRAGGGDSFLPFAIVVTNEAVAAERAIPLLELRGKPGFTSMEAGDLARFSPIDGIDIPRGPAYLVSGIDSGEATLNVTPDDALETIVRDKRSPLTIDEGLALVTHFPEVLETRNSFSMLGSRCGDRRVTAIWISRGAPRLGWCWTGNPHTWLGSASCMGRIGA